MQMSGFFAGCWKKKSHRYKDEQFIIRIWINSVENSYIKLYKYILMLKLIKLFTHQLLNYYYCSRLIPHHSPYQGHEYEYILIYCIFKLKVYTIFLYAFFNHEYLWLNWNEIKMYILLKTISEQKVKFELNLYWPFYIYLSSFDRKSKANRFSWKLKHMIKLKVIPTSTPYFTFFHINIYFSNME